MKKDQEMPKENTPVDNAGLTMSGHILIKDKETGEVLVNKRA